MICKKGMPVTDLEFLTMMLRSFLVIRTDLSLSCYILAGVGDFANSPTARSGFADPKVPMILMSIFGLVVLLMKVFGTVSPLF